MKKKKKMTPKFVTMYFVSDTLTSKRFSLFTLAFPKRLSEVY